MKNVIEIIRQETGERASEFEMLREKWGVYVYRCTYDGRRAVVKYFENEDDRREIANYRLLANIGVPTMKVFALCESCIVMEDINASGEWRLGAEEDMADPQVLGRLAEWYFALHEAGKRMQGLEKLYAESDQLTEAGLKRLRDQLPGAGALCEYAEARLECLRALIHARENTLNYNDFYYTNFIVRRDKSAAMMFDYNLMGRGYRYADFRNVESSASGAAFEAFLNEYRRLYRARYGCEMEDLAQEKALDDFLSPLCGLMTAMDREEFPAWAEEMREEAESGALLGRAERLLGAAYAAYNEQEA